MNINENKKLIILATLYLLLLLPLALVTINLFHSNLMLNNNLSNKEFQLKKVTEHFNNQKITTKKNISITEQIYALSQPKLTINSTHTDSSKKNICYNFSGTFISYLLFLNQYSKIQNQYLIQKFDIIRTNRGVDINITFSEKKSNHDSN